MRNLPSLPEPHPAAAFAAAGLRLDGPARHLYGLAAWQAAAPPAFPAISQINEASA